MEAAGVEADWEKSAVAENDDAGRAAGSLAGLEADGQGLDLASTLLTLLPNRTRLGLQDWSSPRTGDTGMTLSHTTAVKNNSEAAGERAQAASGGLGERRASGNPPAYTCPFVAAPTRLTH